MKNFMFFIHDYNYILTFAQIQDLNVSGVMYSSKKDVTVHSTKIHRDYDWT